MSLHENLPNMTPVDLHGWLQLLEVRHPKTIDLGLERVGQVWQNLGSPRPAHRVFTVAGTNGKGSTVTYLDAMLSALSWRSGTYTSPHIFRYNERVRIEGKEATDEDLMWALACVENAREGISLSYFEHGTLAAFLLMQRAGLDFAVLEVGLGGRLDAVNLIDADCAVITPIGLDHQEFLGPDRESIGREKAGILRPGQCAISGEFEPPASLEAYAAELGINLQRLGHELFVEPFGQGLRWWRGSQELILPLPPLAGPHQHRNLATAVAALSALLPEAIGKPEKLAEGILAARLTGRLQAHPDDPRVLVDVGHNPLAAEVVAQTLQATGRIPVTCVFAMLRDKDAAVVAGILDESVSRWYCAGLEGDRGRAGGQLAQLVAASSHGAVIQVFPDVAEALQAAHRDLQERETILVFGSFLTATQALSTRL
jgi:dihydrofolate synthase/folylpolyglutamate synthase